MSGILELSYLVMILGAKGFTRGGLPFSSERRLQGARGRAVGAACILAGLAGAGFAYWASAPADRERIRLLGRGIAVGLLGAFILVGWSRFEAKDDEPTPDASSAPEDRRRGRS
jgi:hypothetical protein